MTHKVAAIQMISQPKVGVNLFAARSLIEKSADAGAELVVLPECFACMPKKPKDNLLIKEHLGSGRIQDFLASLAEELGIWIVGGTIPVVAKDDDRAYACSIVWDDKGKQVAHYNKIHLFDVELPEYKESYSESSTYCPGDKAVVVDTPVGKLGLSVCYDVRFPELYRSLRNKGAEIFTVPSAFTAATGKMHWKPLLTARAIENQCYVIAANQGGTHDNERTTHGNSMIICPWGITLGCQANGAGYVVSEVDLVRLSVLREDFPVAKHRRLK